MLPSARLFRSRWAALLWAGGILWTAVDFVQSAPHEGAHPTPAGHAAIKDADPADLDAADLAALSNTLDF